MKSDKLRQALSFHTLLVGGNPMNTSALYALIHKLERDGGVWFAKGGTNALIDGMVATVRAAGRDDAARRAGDAKSPPPATGHRRRHGQRANTRPTWSRPTATWSTAMA